MEEGAPYESTLTHIYVYIKRSLGVSRHVQGNLIGSLEASMLSSISWRGLMMSLSQFEAVQELLSAFKRYCQEGMDTDLPFKFS